MDEWIEKTEEFVERKFKESTYTKEHEDEIRYRVEHTYRVAKIGKEIAQKEGLDVEAMIIGCLLHDISYCKGLQTDEEWLEHGRDSAKIAREFLESIGMEKDRMEEICYGIAIHVDGKADFEGVETPLACSISDADNIDRYDAFRLYEGVKNAELEKKTLEEKIEKVDSTIDRLYRLKEEKFTTQTATEIWNQKIDMQIEFYHKLKRQLDNSDGTRLGDLEDE